MELCNYDVHQCCNCQVRRVMHRQQLQCLESAIRPLSCLSQAASDPSARPPLTGLRSACGHTPRSAPCPPPTSSPGSVRWAMRTCFAGNCSLQQASQEPTSAGCTHTAPHCRGPSGCIPRCTSLQGSITAVSAPPHPTPSTHLPQAPVHAHLQRLLQVLGGGGDDALAAHAHRDVVKQRLAGEQGEGRAESSALWPRPAGQGREVGSTAKGGMGSARLHKTLLVSTEVAPPHKRNKYLLQDAGTQMPTATQDGLRTPSCAGAAGFQKSAINSPRTPTQQPLAPAPAAPAPAPHPSQSGWCGSGARRSCGVLAGAAGRARWAILPSGAPRMCPTAAVCRWHPAWPLQQPWCRPAGPSHPLDVKAHATGGHHRLRVRHVKRRHVADGKAVAAVHVGQRNRFLWAGEWAGGVRMVTGTTRLATHQQTGPSSAARQCCCLCNRARCCGSVGT